MAKRQADVYFLRAAVYGQSFWRSGGPYLSGLTLLTTGLLREVPISDTGDIAPVYVTIESGGADCPFPGSFLLVYNNVDGDTIHDLLGNICGEAVVVAQLYFWPFCRGLMVCIVLCDLCRVVPWAAAGFCTKVWIQATLYLTVYGGWSEAKQMGDFKTGLTGIIALLDAETV